MKPRIVFHPFLMICVLASAASLACGASDAPSDDEPSQGALTNANNTPTSFTTAAERDVTCSYYPVAGYRTESFRLRLGAIGGPSRGIYSVDGVASNPPGNDDLAKYEGLLTTTTSREGDSVLVKVKAAFTPLPRDAANGSWEAVLRFPASLWNDPGREATKANAPIFAPDMGRFTPDLVSSAMRMPQLRCEQEAAPQPSFISPQWYIGNPETVEDEPARLFDALDVPLKGSGQRGSSGRPLGSKTIEAKEMFELHCIHNETENIPETIACNMTMLPRVSARTREATTYRLNLTEREGADKLWDAFAKLQGADGRRGITVPALYAYGHDMRGPKSGAKASVQCKKSDALTDCEIEMTLVPIH